VPAGTCYRKSSRPELVHRQPCLGRLCLAAPRSTVRSGSSPRRAPDEATDVYTRQCSLDVTVHDLAVMAATLANGGVNPITGERVVAAGVCRRVLAVMATAGLYELSGDWLYQIGMPGKSGVSGDIVTVSPGKGGLATFSPPLDAAGNSVRGQLVTNFVSERLGLNLFTSEPAEKSSASPLSW
jgi:glutaminase